MPFSFGGKECDILPENILKPKSSKLPLIIIYGILILGVVGFIVYLTYCYNYYLLATNQQTAEFDIESLMNAFAYVGQPMTFWVIYSKKYLNASNGFVANLPNFIRYSHCYDYLGLQPL